MKKKKNKKTKNGKYEKDGKKQKQRPSANRTTWALL